jgi:hypothetical protein
MPYQVHFLREATNVETCTGTDTTETESNRVNGSFCSFSPFCLLSYYVFREQSKRLLLYSFIIAFIFAFIFAGDATGDEVYRELLHRKPRDEFCCRGRYMSYSYACCTRCVARREAILQWFVSTHTWYIEGGFDCLAGSLKPMLRYWLERA